MARSLSPEEDVIRPIVAVKVANPANGRSEAIYALLDSGADRDYLSDRVAEAIGLSTRTRSVNLVTVEESTRRERRMANVELESIDGTYKVEVEDVLVGRFPESTRDIPPAKRDLASFDHLKDIEFINIDARVEAIISIAHAEAWTGMEIRRGVGRSPMALHSWFGWTILGVSGKRGKQDAAISLLGADDEDLRGAVQRIFSNDFPEVDDSEETWSEETRFAVEQMRGTIRFDESKGKYRVGLPWKFGREKAKDLLNKIDSRSMATKRSWSLKRSMERVPDKKKKGFGEMRKFLDNNRAEMIMEDRVDDKREEGPTWHLPSHLVFQKGK